jgi:hypothetical protein
LQKGADGKAGDPTSNNDVFHKLRIVRVIRSIASRRMSVDVAKLKRIW